MAEEGEGYEVSDDQGEEEQSEGHGEQGQGEEGAGPSVSGDPTGVVNLLAQLVAAMRTGTERSGTRETQYRLVEQVVKLPTWEYEVRCLRTEGVPEEHIKQAIRKSLKGAAAKILVSLGETPTVSQILDKFKVVYGQVQTGAALLQKFWSESQQDKENVATWGCRLEKQVQLLREKRKVEGEGDEMMRTKFWSGLRSQRLKEASRHRYDDQSYTYDKLLVEVRSVEQEFQEEKKANWKSYVPALVHAYNCTRHESTGYSPYYLMFGRNPRLPVDLYLGIEFPKEQVEYSEYVSGLRDRLDYVYKLATLEGKKAAAKNKEQYDRKIAG